jgi:hypothetical protein
MCNAFFVDIPAADFKFANESFAYPMSVPLHGPAASANVRRSTPRK